MSITLRTTLKSYLILLTGVFFTSGCQPVTDESVESTIDTYLSLPLSDRQSPDHATDAFEVADSLEITLFAAEPMVVNPTNITIDDRGRIWVCESYNYAVPENEQEESGGRITILEDTDGDGKADKRTVFYQGVDVHLALGIAVFGDKVYVTRSPNLLVFTDEDGDDIPDSKEILFTGMGRPGDHSAHAVVFGPDGRFYFNYGNAGQKIETPDGELAVDIHGNKVISDGHPFFGGMVFRFEEGGENLEILAHNFRNNYEVAIDAFGTLWQSDNDDDGNKSVRINYVMEYGNYGYLDENTGAHWSQPRIGMHDSIPMRHWHQNDPGVIPNVLITGAGSPAGINIYEGTLLPKAFHGQMIHTDAGPNIVRAYPVKYDGAGYSAHIKNIARNNYDQWFRPVDVAVAPDGSLFVADWYDPIVGGGAAGDHAKGRIFRIAPPGHLYKIDTMDFTSLESSVKLLSNPNEATRYKAWQAIKQAGQDAEGLLKKIFSESKNKRHRARALWLLGRLSNKGAEYVNQALEDPSEDIRVTAVRLARQLNMPILDLVGSMMDDPSPAVRRELAIALRFETDPRSSMLWANLASQHTGGKWYLEALGIGADLNWTSRFASWREGKTDPISTKPDRDIVWRSRASAATSWLAKIIQDPQVDSTSSLKFFRAFDFHTQSKKNQDLLALLAANHPDKDRIRRLTIQSLDADHVEMTPSLKLALDQTLNELYGTWQFVELVKKYDLKERSNELLSMGYQSFENDAAFEAIGLLARPEWEGLPLIEERIRRDDSISEALVNSLRASVNGTTLSYLGSLILDTTFSIDLRKRAIEVLGASWPGETALLETVKQDGFPDELKPAAAAILFSVYRVNIQDEAAQYLDRPGSSGEKSLPPVRVLVATTGNADKGSDVFQRNCQTCHQVAGEGIDFGPDLSQIGAKLDAEGLYRSIIYPNEGVSHGFETYELTLADGTTIVGLLSNQTHDEVELKLIGGLRQKYPATEGGLKVLENSLMPDLTSVMSEEELVDLVTYLQSLRPTG